MNRLHVVRDGVVVGLIASIAVPLFYAAFDVLASRGLFYTADTLGQALFNGVRDPAWMQQPHQPDFGAVLRFDALHTVVSLAIGFTVTWLAAQAERRREQAWLAGLVLFGGFVVTVLVVGRLTEFMRPVMPWWSIVGANLAAVGCCGWYLTRRAPGIADRLLPLGQSGPASPTP